MKKVFLLFMILGLTSISFIEIKAFTFNGSYDFNNIDLDTPLSELNGASLNEIFDYEYLNDIPLTNINGYRNGYDLDSNNNVTFYEYVYYNEVSFNINNLNKIINNDFSNNDLYWTLINYSYLGQSNDEGHFYTASSYPLLGYQITENPNDKIFYYIEFKTDENVLTYLRPNNVNIGSLNGFNNWTEYYGDSYTDSVGNFSFYVRNQLTSGTNIYLRNWSYINMTELGIEHYTNENMRSLLKTGQTIVIDYNTTPIENNDLVQSLYIWNLENLPINTIKYYFAVFLLHKYNLPVDDLWNNAFNAGEASGYDTGYDFGLLDGFLQGENYGYNQGYDDGVLEEIDTQYLLGFVEGTVNILGVSIIPGITLGVFVFIPLFLGFIGFIFRLGGRRG